MGRHSARGRWPHNRLRQGAGSGRAVDPDDRALVEPDRDLAGLISDDERAAREAVHTDREPRDDVHLAAQDSGGRQAVSPTDTDIDQTDPADVPDRERSEHASRL